jgi:hypothetical protein
MFCATTAGPSASATPYGVVSPATRGLGLTGTLAGRACDPWERCVRELQALFGLQDDWDGEGSAAPAPANVETAVRLLQLASRFGEFPPPQVVPGGNGEVILAWRDDPVYLEAEVVTPGRIEWMLAAPGQQTKHWAMELPARQGSQPPLTSGRTAQDQAVSAVISSRAPAA